MNDFRINYNKLKNLEIVGIYKVIIIVILLFSCLIILAFKITMTSKLKVYGIYKDNILQIKINNTLSEKIKDSEYITLNEKRINYKIVTYGEYEYINNDIYQSIYIDIDANLADNEVVLVEINYDKKLLAKYIFELFK